MNDKEVEFWVDFSVIDVRCEKLKEILDRLRFMLYIFNFFMILDFGVDVRLKYDVSMDDRLFQYVNIVSVNVKLDIVENFGYLKYLKLDFFVY